MERTQPATVELDGGDPSAGGAEGGGERTVAGTKIEDVVVRPDAREGDESAQDLSVDEVVLTAWLTRRGPPP